MMALLIPAAPREEVAPYDQLDNLGLHKAIVGPGDMIQLPELREELGLPLGPTMVLLHGQGQAGQQLPINFRATRLAGIQVYGDALLGQEHDGQFIGLSEHERERALVRLPSATAALDTMAQRTRELLQQIASTVMQLLPPEEAAVWMREQFDSFVDIMNRELDASS